MSKIPSQSFQMQFPQGLAVAFDAQEFDAQIRNQGTVFTHFRAMRCPAGMIDRSDIRKPHPDHLNCSNGFLYQNAGNITLLFSGNGHQIRGFDAGVLDSSTVQVTIPTTYDCSHGGEAGEFVFVAPFDRFYLKEPEGKAPLVVPNWELLQQHATGYDRTQFPCVKVTDLVDSGGENYSEGADFEVVNGQIHWTGTRRPGIDPASGKGKVYSVRYLYRPYYYLQRMLHEIRLSQVDNQVTGERHVERFAQAALIVREFVFEKNLNDSEKNPPEHARDIKAPESGSFGPR